MEGFCFACARWNPKLFSHTSSLYTPGQWISLTYTKDTLTWKMTKWASPSLQDQLPRSTKEWCKNPSWREKKWDSSAKDACSQLRAVCFVYLVGAFVPNSPCFQTVPWLTVTMINCYILSVVWHLPPSIPFSLVWHKETRPTDETHSFHPFFSKYLPVLICFSDVEGKAPSMWELQADATSCSAVWDCFNWKSIRSI